MSEQINGKALPFTLEQIGRIAGSFPTPFYLYDEAGIRGAARALQAAFAWAPAPTASATASR